MKFRFAMLMNQKPTFFHSHNYCWTFQILPGILPAKKKEWTEYLYHCWMQNLWDSKNL